MASVVWSRYFHSPEKQRIPPGRSAFDDKTALTYERYISVHTMPVQGKLVIFIRHFQFPDKQ